MTKSIVFEGNSWIEYEHLRNTNTILFKNLIKILKEMIRNDPSQGIGKPEMLKHNFSGYWSRRISPKDRLIYKYNKQSIYIFAIGGHYDVR